MVISIIKYSLSLIQKTSILKTEVLVVRMDIYLQITTIESGSVKALEIFREGDVSEALTFSESRDTKEPTMAELRESGAIEQDASNIIMLWNLSDNDKGAKGVKIEKNRQGMTMREAMEFDGDHMKFVEIEKPFNDVVSEIKKKERGDGFKPYNGDCPF